jgi:hypothetical protein
LLQIQVEGDSLISDFSAQIDLNELNLSNSVNQQLQTKLSDFVDILNSTVSLNKRKQFPVWLQHL